RPMLAQVSLVAFAKHIVVALTAAPFASFRTMRRHRHLPRVLERLTDARGERETASILADSFRDELDVPMTHLLIRGADGSFRDPLASGVRLESDSGLVALLEESSEPLDLSASGSVLPLLRQRDREWTVANGLQLVVPVRWRDDHDHGLAGFVAVGPKSS